MQMNGTTCSRWSNLSIHVVPSTRANFRRNLKYTLSLVGSMSRAFNTASYALNMARNDVPSSSVNAAVIMSFKTWSSVMSVSAVSAVYREDCSFVTTIRYFGCVAENRRSATGETESHRGFFYSSLGFT
jgi:hypothetical protein